MLKKIFTKEVKIGISVIAALVILIVGINFLKGINIFTPKNHYYVHYESLDGLVVSNNVMIRGYKVGEVRDIHYDFSKEVPFTVHFTINDNIYLPKNTEAILFDDGLMGGKAIDLVFTKENEVHSSGDTLTGGIRAGMFAELAEMIPQLRETFSKVDSILEGANKLIQSDEIKNSLASIESITKNFESSSVEFNKLMNNQIPSIVDTVEVMINNLGKVSEDLKGIEYKEIVSEINKTITNLKVMTEKLNSKDNSIGLLINDKALYDSLNSTVNSANKLMIDLKENPKRYVHFSIFGKKENKE